ncbi:MAG: selA [Gemmatimonadetes bacterium]|nr:selA [Gemmatimonadota bacterium]
MSDERRALPSVSSLLETDGVRALCDRAPRTLVVDAIRLTIDAARSAPSTAPSGGEAWSAAVASALDRLSQPSLRPVINGTGVVLHTNLGRAPLPQAAIDAVARVAAGFTNLEYDVEQGARGSRYTHCAALLRELTGAEDALVVNNCAAALVLVLNTLADQRGAIVSRGELVEIGGSFRIPEIMGKSGARLVEVGTTNRTNVEDYRRAIDADTGIVAKVHRSNFAVSGFVAEASAADLGTLALERGIPFLHDLGSGLLLALEAFGLSGEPTAREAVTAAGKNGVVTMSGDKLLGGPQAGIILGSRATLDRIRTNPLTRSYRVDKLTLAALEATLALYRDPPRALREIPALAQLTCDATDLRTRAERIQASLGSSRVAVVDSEASVGGGAFPTARIPSVALAIAGDAGAIESKLRAGDPPLIARVADGRVVVDLRAIFPREDTAVVAALRGALA